jgi:chromosome segregation ATPase
MLLLVSSAASAVAQDKKEEPTPRVRENLETMIRALQDRQEALAKHSEEMAKRRVQLKQQLAEVQAELTQLKHQPQVLDAEQAMMDQQLRMVREQLVKLERAKVEALALSAQTKTVVFKLRHSRAVDVAS